MVARGKENIQAARRHPPSLLMRCINEIYEKEGEKGHVGMSERREGRGGMNKEEDERERVGLLTCAAIVC